MKSYSEAYKQAGVDITAGYKAVELMKKHIAKTATGNEISGIGGFGGLFSLDISNTKKSSISKWYRWSRNKTKNSIFDGQA